MTNIITPLTIPFADSRTDNYDPTIINDPNFVNQPYGFPVNQSLDPGDVDFKPVTEEQMNGTLNFYTDKIYQQGLGKQYTFDQDVSDATPAPHGYPQGAILYCASNDTHQRSLIDNNTANFVATPAYINDNVNWQQFGQQYMPHINDTANTINITGPGGLAVTAGGIFSELDIRSKGNIYTTNVALVPQSILWNDGHITATQYISANTFISAGTHISAGTDISAGTHISAGTDISAVGTITSDKVSINEYYGSGLAGRLHIPDAGTSNNYSAVLGDIPTVPFVPTITMATISGPISGGTYVANIQRTLISTGNWVTVISGATNTNGVNITDIPLPIGAITQTVQGAAGFANGTPVSTGSWGTCAALNGQTSLRITGGGYTGLSQIAFTIIFYGA